MSRFALTDKQLYWAAMAGLAILLVVIVASVSVLPAQDLPQHLAYARIFIDYPRADLRFGEFYLLPTQFEPYFTIYFVLAALGRTLSLDVAIRVVFIAFVVAVLLAAHHLVSSCSRDGRRRWSEPAWPALLGCLVVFGPTTTLGFLSFMLCVPVFLLAAGALVGWLGPNPHRSDPVIVVGASIVLPSMHVVAAAMFLAVVVLHLVLNRKWNAWRKALLLVSTTAVVAWGWNRWGNLGVGRPPDFDLSGAYARTYGFEIVNPLFKLNWSDPPVILSYLSWTVLGPFRWGAQLLVLGALLSTIAYVRRQSRPPASFSNPLERTALAFALCCLVTPWGLYVPSEVTFINLRMIGLAFALLLAIVDPAWFTTRRAQVALVALCSFCVVHYGVRTLGFSNEARDALGLVARVPGNKVLMSLVYHNQSAHFAKQFRLTHFLPMYYTVKSGGINAQFWAKYTDHLPIAYRPDRQPVHTPDWKPEKFEASHLDASDYVLVQTANEDDSREVQKASASAIALLGAKADTVGCAGLWCLYRIRH